MKPQNMPLVSKNTLKFIKSLQLKKFRKEHSMFLVEGVKSVLELLNSNYETEMVLYTAEVKSELAAFIHKSKVSYSAVGDVIRSVSSLENNYTAIAVAKILPTSSLELKANTGYLCIDGLQDPGNLGTIVRTADWFGISQVVCSPDTVDFYNPKVITATKGSFTRVHVYYMALANILAKAKLLNMRVIGTFLHGEPLHHAEKGNAVWVIGSESRGISPELFPFIEQKITIPPIGQAESLNAGVATGIVLYHFLGS